ncbi:MAG: efflux RND transporter periplasmic adaptor subunit [Paracoccaceae bacterium]
MRVLLSSAALVAAFAVAAPLWADTAAAPADAAATPAAASNSDLPAITVTTVTTRKLQDHVLASGLIGPVEQVIVQPLIEGQPIESLAVDVGDTVKAGEVLATLSPATLTLQKSQLLANVASVKAGIAQADAQLLDAQSSADEAKRVADRTAALLKQGSATNAANDTAQSGLTSATARVTVANAALESAKAQETLVNAQIQNIDLQLSRTNVVAPVAGIVVGRNAQLGAIATAAGTPMFTLVRDGALELRADVAEADISRLKDDQNATLQLAASSRTITGHIRLVEPTVDATSRLGRVRIFIDPDTSVRSGMFAEADILVSDRETLAVPVSAVGSEGRENTVMAVKDGVVSRVVITTGIRDGGWVEVLSGLTDGETIVAKAGAFVSSGDKINPVPAPAETN